MATRHRTAYLANSCSLREYRGEAWYIKTFVDRNHPCIDSWGLCNETNGQNPPAYAFARNMLSEAKRIDPSRLCSYASNSLFHSQAKDISGLMDFVECNEYIDSWQSGGPVELDHLLDEIHIAFPDKPVVLSAYGYCACTADPSEGDGHRVAVLTNQNQVLRKKPFISGAIFFCDNDYRTHVGAGPDRLRRPTPTRFSASTLE